MNWHKLNKVLPQKVSNLSDRAQIDGVLVCRLWQEYAAKFFLTSVMQNHEAINFRDGILTINVSIRRHLPEIKAKQGRIVRLTNKALGKNLITKVKYNF